MNVPTLRAAAVVITLAASAACASTGADTSDRYDARDRVTVTVENQNWQDANIYLVGSGPRVRLGTVATNARERFVVPRSLVGNGSVRLLVDLIGSRASEMTEPILIYPGASISWTLQNHLALSSFRVH